MLFRFLLVLSLFLSIICNTRAFLTIRRAQTNVQGFTKIRRFSTTILNNDISWGTLDSLLRKQEPRTERTAFDVVTSGQGNAHINARIRLFDAPENFTPSITLYRDASAWYGFLCTPHQSAL